jgi:uncharacterized protein (TIGR03067 family)
MKRSRTVSTLVLVLTLMARGIAADPAKAGSEERAKLAGTWRGFAVEGKGENPDRGPVKIELTITETTIHGIEKKGQGQIDHGVGEYVFDFGARPAALDASKTNERGRREAWIGIYELDGDVLRWCVANASRGARPTTFETIKGQFLLILKRDKAAK